MSALLSVPPAGPDESALFLSGLAQAKGLDLGGGFDFKSILSNPALLAVLLPLILGLLKGSSGGGAGKPGELPAVPPPPKPGTPPVPTPASGERGFQSLKGSYGNFQHGKSGGGVRERQRSLPTREMLRAAGDRTDLSMPASLRRRAHGKGCRDTTAQW